MRTGKWTAAILAALLLLPTFASCSGNDGTQDDSSAGTTDTSAPVSSQEDTSADTTPVETEATLLFDRENNDNTTFTILTGTETNYEYLDEEKSDRVSMAIADRNRSVEEYLGIKLNVIDEMCNTQKGAPHNQKIIASIEAGDGAYDYVTGMISRIVPTSTASSTALWATYVSPCTRV